jgi:hypothetical protein
MLVVLFNWVRIMLSLESRAGFDVSFVVDGAPVWQHAVISMWVPAIFVLMRRAVPFGRPSAGDALTAGFMLRLGRRDYDVKSAALLREAVENLISTDFRSQLQHTRNVLSRLASTANRDDIRSDAATSLRAIEEASRLWRSRWYRYFANGATIVVLRHEALRALLDPV